MISQTQVDQARTLLLEAVKILETPPTPPEPASQPLATPAALDLALLDAVPGTRLLLAPTLVYPKPLKVPRGVTLESAVAPPAGRMSKDAPAPRFQQGATLEANSTILGLDIRHTNPLTDIVVFHGAAIAVRRCRILGDPVAGAKRGIAANGEGACVIAQCYIDDCFQAYPGNDSQAICAWDMAPGLLIEDCYLSGGSETIMIGGADPATPARQPRGIIIRGNTITKNPAWQARAIGVKNVLELKNCRDVVIEDNEISQSWGGRGQTGYLLMLTVRNQGGTAPTSTIQDVIIRQNRCARGAAAINLLGRDDGHESDPMARITITRNTFTDLDPGLYAGSKHLVQIGGGPSDLAITHNTFAGKGLASALYFTGTPALLNFTWVGNTYPKTTYGIFGSGATVGKAWGAFVSSGVNGPNTEG